MKIIKYLSEAIERELDKAEEYAKKAIEYKEDFPEVSKVLLSRSQARVEDVSALHSVIINVINNYRAKEGEPPAPMMAVYNYLHERQIEKAAAVKRLQDLYKTGL